MRAVLKIAFVAITLATGVTAIAEPASAHHFVPDGGLRFARRGCGHGLAFVGGYGVDPCVRRRPMFDDRGRFMGRRPVNVCY